MLLLFTCPERALVSRKVDKLVVWVYNRSKKKIGGRWMNTMAKKGDKVIFRYPDSGSLDSQEKVKKHLVLHTTYTVERTDHVGFWWFGRLDVYLQEVEGVAFYSGHFVDIGDTDWQ